MFFSQLNGAVNYVVLSVSSDTKIIFAVRGDRGHDDDVLKCYKVTGAGADRVGSSCRPADTCVWPT